jgi:putative two-component system response regulator
MITSDDILHGRVLIVDDQEANVLLLERMLSAAGYTSVSSTLDPREVNALHRANRYDLILLDLQMPGMDGFQVMEALRELEPDGFLPVLVITAQPGHKLRAFRAGARDFISKPFELPEVLARVRNMLESRLLQRELHDYNDVLEEQVRDRTAELKDSYMETVFAMTRAAEHKDEHIGTHSKRIGYASLELAGALGLETAFRDQVFIASPMHDVGKIGIPDRVLLKPAPLTPAEWEIMKGHAVMGFRILGNSRSPHLTMAADIALNHHERWDGGGYPGGISGEDIPLAARIMNICDVYDALRSERPYKVAYDHAHTMDIIVRGDGRTRPDHFDPAVLSAFARGQQSFCDLYDSFADEERAIEPATGADPC